MNNAPKDDPTGALAEAMRLKPCPFCGSKPVLLSQYATYGHGDGGHDWWVECPCGIRTRPVTNYEGKDSRDAEGQKAIAVRIWNRRIADHSEVSRDG